ncbi:MAG TPA: hypothetical protein H9710_01670 [Candidatus Acutalibacter pullicola]|uniref:MORN repeat-containing protein n=1 Tax=Candidatus Acutalibacter pullicola TaxID=2838417 RepID=A0A9D2MUD9_9FIRM|nr:hypothetical protein [Candidatus Acutalibacter pullicola]
MSTSASTSLLARHVYCVCFPQRDGLDFLHGELARARESFYTGGAKAVRISRRETIRGYEGKLRGKLSRRGFFWRKTVGPVAGAKKRTLEESFDQPGGTLLVTRDFQGLIKSRVFFDKNHRWIRSEYYEPWDNQQARVTFKPVEASSDVERFDWDRGQQRCRSTLLSPVAYEEGTSAQSLANARFGEPQLLVSTEEGVFCYCPPQEAQARQAAAKELQGGAVFLLPAWEVREGSLAQEEEGPLVTFSSLEDYAHLEEPSFQASPASEKPAPVQEAASAPNISGKKEGQPSAPKAEAASEKPAPVQEAASAPNASGKKEGQPSAPKAETASKKPAPVQEAVSAPVAPEKEEEQPPAWQENQEDREILERARAASQSNPVSTGASAGAQGVRVRTQGPGGLTAYEGEFRNGKRDGFGSCYYANGDLSYAGFWKGDKKDGLGVSFREGDHVLHISHWNEGTPGEFVSLFDQQGNLRYGGRMENGKKQGAGVSYKQEDGTVFVGQWKDGQPTGMGSAYDREGHLVYYGGWDQGKPSGHGTEFDPTGAIVFDGEWKDGAYYNGVLYRKPDGEPSEEERPLWES